jgi:hypothetical protein
MADAKAVVPTPAPAAPAPPKTTQTAFQIAWAKAKRDALRGGVPGMIAMALQVLTLMWLRTAVNYQYRHGGTSMRHALKTLYAQGGVRRLYSGLGFALMQAPLSRFGDTAANAGVLSLLDNLEQTKGLPVGVKTFGASFSAGCFRIFLMPIDALKTSMQVDGKQGLPILMNKVRTQGFFSLYRGAIAASTATFVGHYPWFATYNFLDSRLPKGRDLKERLARSACMGFVSSAISDTCSNSIRVVKTVRQTSAEKMTYKQVVQKVIAEEGLKGLFGRGLSTKIITNGIQGTMFSVFWRLGQDAWEKKYGKH